MTIQIVQFSQHEYHGQMTSYAIPAFSWIRVYRAYRKTMDSENEFKAFDASSLREQDISSLKEALETIK